jgi:hypothetical protein
MAALWPLLLCVEIGSPSGNCCINMDAEGNRSASTYMAAEHSPLEWISAGKRQPQRTLAGVAHHAPGQPACGLMQPCRHCRMFTHISKTPPRSCSPATDARMNNQYSSFARFSLAPAPAPDTAPS